MVTVDTFRSIALSFPDAEESPHFHRMSFRIKRKIFATLDAQQKIVVVKFTAVDQSAFCAFDASVIRPVKGAWGRRGWTEIDLAKVRRNTLLDAVTTAYATVGTQLPPKK